MMKILLSVLLTFFATLASGERVARIIYYDAPAGAPQKVFVYQNDIEAQEVALDKHNFSESFDIADGAIRMAFLPTLLPIDGVLPVDAPTVGVPEDWTKVLILVFQDESNSVMPIRLQAINASDNVFVPGGTFFANFSEMTVFGKVGDKKLLSKPMTVEFIKQPIESKGMYLVHLFTYQDDLKKRRPLVRQKCQYHPEVRVITFISPMPPPRMVKIYSVPIPDL